MQIKEALNSLEKSWSREEILVKIKNGEDSEKIVDDFLDSKQKEIDILSNFINIEDKVLLNQIENISNIESKLINKIKNYSYSKINLSKEDNDKKNFSQQEKMKSFNLGHFMMKWSNKFVFISLLVISAIALTKQAWA